MGRPRNAVEKFDDAIDKLTDLGPRPRGPYTLWCNYESGWQFKDFERLDDALNYAGRPTEFIIMKPVQYRVVEEGTATPQSFRRAEVPQPGEEELEIGPPTDPDNPDSGNARYL